MCIADPSSAAVLVKKRAIDTYIPQDSLPLDLCSLGFRAALLRARRIHRSGVLREHIGLIGRSLKGQRIS